MRVFLHVWVCNMPLSWSSRTHRTAMYSYSISPGRLLSQTPRVLINTFYTFSQLSPNRNTNSTDDLTSNFTEKESIKCIRQQTSLLSLKSTKCLPWRLGFTPCCMKEAGVYFHVWIRAFPLNLPSSPRHCSFCPVLCLLGFPVICFLVNKQTQRSSSAFYRGSLLLPRSISRYGSPPPLLS